MDRRGDELIDTQRTAVVAAMDAARQHTGKTIDVLECAEHLGIPESKIHLHDGVGMCVKRGGAEISTTAEPMTVLHALAHMATPDIFPPHGSEFCANLLRATSRFFPRAGHVLEAKFQELGVHYSDEHRRKAVIKAVVQRAVDGTSRVEAVFGAPPQRVEGSFRYDRRSATITVDDQQFELDRLRYLSRVS